MCTIVVGLPTYLPLSYDAFGVVLSPLQLLERSGAPGASVTAIEVRQYFRHHVTICSPRVRFVQHATRAPP